MSISPKISLLTIEKAIRANCLIDDKADKRLSLKLTLPGHLNKGIGRTLFIYFALQAGHERADVVNFLECGVQEWDTRIRQYEELYGPGRVTAGEALPKDLAAFFYRKLRLVANMLHLSADYELNKEKAL